MKAKVSCINGRMQHYQLLLHEVKGHTLLDPLHKKVCSFVKSPHIFGVYYMGRFYARSKFLHKISPCNI